MATSMRWFRMYGEARMDRKLDTLTDAQHRVWFNLLCYAADQESRGTLPIEDEELLALEVARGDTALLMETIQRLVKLRILSIDGQVLTFINFDERQRDKPSQAKEAVRERVKKHREKKQSALPALPALHDESAALQVLQPMLHEEAENGDVTLVTPEIELDVTPVTPVTHRGEEIREDESREDNYNLHPSLVHPAGGLESRVEEFLLLPLEELPAEPGDAPIKYPEWFEKLWALYPLKSGKLAALNAVTALNKLPKAQKPTSIHALESAVKHYVTWCAESGQPLKMLSTFFSSRNRWYEEWINGRPAGLVSGTAARTGGAHAAAQGKRTMGSGDPRTVVPVGRGGERRPNI